MKIEELKEKIKQKEESVEEMLTVIEDLKKNVFAKDVVIREKRTIVKDLEGKLENQKVMLDSESK